MQEERGGPGRGKKRDVTEIGAKEGKGRLMEAGEGRGKVQREGGGRQGNGEEGSVEGKGVNTSRRAEKKGKGR